MRKPLAVLFIFTPLMALSACGNPDTPGGRAADARHENFEAMGDAFKSINDELKGQAPDAQKVRTAAATVALKAKDLPTWFPAGSGPADGMKTDAKAEVWTKAAEFSDQATKFLGAADKLLTSADAFASGQPVAALQDAVKEAGGSCKSCHEKFKED